MNSSIKLTQVAKVLVSFASFCFLYPNALGEFGRAEVAGTVEERASKKAPTA